MNASLESGGGLKGRRRAKKAESPCRAGENDGNACHEIYTAVVERPTKECCCWDTVLRETTLRPPFLTPFSEFREGKEPEKTNKRKNNQQKISPFLFIPFFVSLLTYSFMNNSLLAFAFLFHSFLSSGGWEKKIVTPLHPETRFGDKFM